MGKQTINRRTFFKEISKTFTSTKYILKFVSVQKHGKKYMYLKFLFSLFGLLSTFIYTVFPGLIIKELTGHQRKQTLLLYLSILLFLPVCLKIIDRFSNKYIAQLSLSIQADLIKKFDMRMAMLDYETIEDSEFRDLQERIGGTYRNAHSVADCFIQCIISLLKLFTIFSIIASLNVSIIIIVFVVICFNVLITKHLNNLQYENKKELSKFDRYLGGLFYVFYDGNIAQELRLFNLADFFSNILYNKRTEANKIHLKNIKQKLNSEILFSITNFFQQAILYSYLIFKVLFHGLSIGDMTIQLSAVGQVGTLFNEMVRKILELERHSLIIQDIIFFEDIPLCQHQTGTKTPVFNNNSIIEFRNVSFKYPKSNQYVLKNFNLTIHGNERLCIVGSNGVGKTTFIKLLTRLYNPSEGEILLNGININEYEYIKYQRLFAPVLQNYALYWLTLRENIILSNEYSEKKLNKICEKCGLSSFLEKHSRGFDTPLLNAFNDGGIIPSGGESQRIAIARACYHGGEIFLLDEPTATLDPISEYEIYRQFNEMITNKCAILITHRLSAVQLVDKIALFHDGKVYEYGTHKELYKKKGIYTEMFDKQAQFYRDSEIK